jgi:hypothetical protein
MLASVLRHAGAFLELGNAMAVVRTEGDQGDQPLVAGSVADLGARETQIVVDHQALLS